MPVQYAVHPPFRFVSWLRLHGLDLITMAAMGAIGLGVYQADPAPSRSFPLYFRDGEVVYPEFAYPLRKEIIPIYAAALIAFFAPFLVVCIVQIRRRSIDDLLTTTMGILKGLITAAVFQVFLKWLIGGLRPHFYAVCKPNIDPGTVSGVGFESIMYDRTVCTGDRDEINDSLESFPSGHSTAGWAGLFFMALYINAQLKVMSEHNPAYWKMIATFAPLLGATLISGALTIDEFHNWYDVVAGAIIGICCATVAFRQTFAAVLDFRFNHILLPRASSVFLRHSTSGLALSFGYALPAEISRLDMPFTREGAWALGSRYTGGAPSDATGLGAGSGGAFNGGHGGGALGLAEAGNAGLKNGHGHHDRRI
ncbi:acid phosphatase/Vanadium-dependent haloperoxidase [Cylindrobasidium torrendii FP15055 ss-10]|uniref:Acid phosphatase/Vanadium-dependent haloperoxidase n=1 Tax=Cylindrobasidium torrendii FP15055 ss-10 TaxID=1314674 RepID=A0A0D7BIX1_9AGAR|nr:acid phosphatase/Vanadium-dependent haloperoxidase [Cylindrobasidium torrendii FP15055 ss-10]